MGVNNKSCGYCSNWVTMESEQFGHCSKWSAAMDPRGKGEGQDKLVAPKQSVSSAFVDSADTCDLVTGRRFHCSGFKKTEEQPSQDPDQLEQIKYLDYALEQLIIRAYHFDNCPVRSDVEFWGHIQRTLGESVCLHWCFIFGNKNEDFHFTKFFTDVEGDFSLEKVKRRLLATLEMDDSAYKSFWKEVMDARNKFFAHREIGASALVPKVVKCRLQAEELRRVLSEYAMMRSIGDTNWEDWVNHYMGQPPEIGSMKSECSADFKSAIGMSD